MEKSSGMVGDVPDDAISSKSTFHGGSLKVWRLHQAWVDCYYAARNGNYREWKLTLDFIFNELIAGYKSRLDGGRKDAPADEFGQLIAAASSSVRQMLKSNRKSPQFVALADKAYADLSSYEQALRVESLAQGLDVKMSKGYDFTSGF